MNIPQSAPQSLARDVEFWKRVQASMHRYQHSFFCSNFEEFRSQWNLNPAFVVDCRAFADEFMRHLGYQFDNPGNSIALLGYPQTQKECSLTEHRNLRLKFLDWIIAKLSATQPN